ncbi:MAG TPA: hypothetical protein VFS94_12700 [Gemmatimonadales bacterium]|nr:hypothetical protein [Gemmatimonadales bacterium]
MKAICVALLSPLVLAACAAGGEHAATRVDSAGVEIVTSSAEDLPAPWSLVEVGKFGGELGDTILVSSAERLTVIAGSDRFYALDPRASRVVVIDTLGMMLRAFGRAGDGPGELRYPAALSVLADTVTVLDLNRGRLVFYSSDGETLGDEPIPEAHNRSFRVGYFGHELVMDRRSQDSTGVITEVLVVARGDSGVLERHWSPTPGSAELTACGMRVVMRAMPLFAPRLQWSSSGDWLAVVSSADYDIMVHHVGSAPRRVRRAIQARKASEELARQYIGESWKLGIDNRDCDVAPDEVMEQMGVADLVPAIQDVMIDADGWLRIQRFVVGDEPVLVDIFNPDGEYVGTFTGANPMPAAAFGDYVATATEDSLGFPTIVVSRIDGRDS